MIKIYKHEFIKGFSLIELMVVISIIAILSSISIFALNQARISGRNAKRKADLSQIASALELYKADCNTFPEEDDIPQAGSQFKGCTENLYIEAMPDDPDDSKNYFYVKGCCSFAGCACYKLWAALETSDTTPPSYCDAAPNGCGSATCNYCIAGP